MAYKRKSGRWGARIYDAHVGRQIPLGTFDRKKDAEAKERLVRRELELGEYVERKRIGFTDFIDLFLSSAQVSESTLEDYTNTCRHLKKRFRNRLLNQIPTQELDQFVAEFSKSHEWNTTQKMRTRIKQVFRLAVKWGYLATSPAEDLTRLPRKRKERVRVLQASEVRRLIEATSPYWRIVIQFAVMTGLRRNEIFGLTWDCIRWDHAQVEVKQQLLMGGGLGPPKTEASYRTVDVGPALLMALKEHRLACAPSELDLVFPTPEGNPVHTSNFHRDVFSKARLKAGLAEYTLHDLRHTFASALIKGGCTPKYLQTVLGHGSIQVSYDIYGHLFDETNPAAAKGLENWLSPSETDEECGEAVSGQ